MASLNARQSPLLQNLSAEARGEMLRRGVQKRVPGRAILAHQGDLATTFYVVESGWLKLTQLTADGRQVVVRFVGPGEPFGGVAALEISTYPVTAQAVVPARVLAWSRPVLTDVISRFPEIRTSIMQVLADHVTSSLTLIRELATEPVPRRLAHALLRLAEQAGCRTARGVLLEPPLSRQELAEMTGTTLYTASRTLSEWQAAGVVETARRSILIRSPERLRQIAEGG